MTKTAAKATRSSRPSIPAKAAGEVGGEPGRAGHRGLESVAAPSARHDRAARRRPRRPRPSRRPARRPRRPRRRPTRPAATPRRRRRPARPGMRPRRPRSASASASVSPPSRAYTTMAGMTSAERNPAWRSCTCVDSASAGRNCDCSFSTTSLSAPNDAPPAPNAPNQIRMRTVGIRTRSQAGTRDRRGLSCVAGSIPIRRYGLTSSCRVHRKTETPGASPRVRRRQSTRIP